MLKKEASKIVGGLSVHRAKCRVTRSTCQPGPASWAPSWLKYQGQLAMAATP